MAQVATPNLKTIDPAFLRQFDDNPGKPCNQMFSISYIIQDLLGDDEQKTTGSSHDSLSNQSQLPNKNKNGTNPTGNHNLKKIGHSENLTNTSLSVPSPPEHPSNGPPKRKRPSSHIKGSAPNGQLHDSPPTGMKLEKSLGSSGQVARKGPKCPNLISQKQRVPTSRHFVIKFRSPSYIEIKHVQAFNIESFIGNVGGYVGLFIGVAVWQAPELIEILYEKTKWTLETFFRI